MSLRTAMRVVVCATLLGLTGCPQMFVYVPEGADSILAVQYPETSTPEFAACPCFHTVSVLGGSTGELTEATAVYRTDQLISIECDTRKAVIYYTLDGTDPDPYSADARVFDPDHPIRTRGDGTTVVVTAVALVPQMYPSEVARVAVSIDFQRASTPSISPASGTRTEDFEITLESQDDDAEIWYVFSTSGPVEDPDPDSSQHYDGPISVSGNGTQAWIKAIATVDQLKDSVVNHAEYTIEYLTAAAVTFTPPQGTYSSDQSVELHCATPGAEIWFTTDGSDPVPGVDGPYAAPVPVAGNGTDLWIKATATAAQMLAAPQTAAHYVIDYTQPPPPPTPDLTGASDTGSSSNDDVTNDATPTFTVTVPAAGTIKLYESGSTQVASAVVGASGTHDVTTSTLADGLRQISATFTEGGGPESGLSAALEITVDTVSPVAPGSPDLDAADDTGLATNDNVTRNTTGLTFAISAPEAGTLELFRGGTTSLGAVTATGAGTFIVDGVALAAGSSYSITARLTDTAGNTSIASSALIPLVIDATAPSAPGAPDLDSADDSGTSSTDNVTGTTTDLTFHGASGAVADGRIYLYRAGSTLIGFVDTPSGGAWTVDGVLDVLEGANSITATAVDAAGNESAASSALSLTIDTTPPPPPAAPDLKTSSDSGSSASDDITNDNTPTFSVTVSAAGTIRLYEDGATQVASLTVGASGTYDVTASTLAEGAPEISATITDTAGNESAQSAVLEITVDTVGETPAQPDLEAGSDTGQSSTDGITNDATPLFDITVAEGGTIDLYCAGSTHIASAPAAAASTYPLNSSVLANATHSITARLTDLAGNVSVASSALIVTVDTVPPVVSTPDMELASDTGASNTDNITQDTTPDFIVSASEAGMLRLYRAGSIMIGTTPSTGPAVYIMSSTPLLEGVHGITATLEDVAGNLSPSSAMLSITIDMTPPPAPYALNLATADDDGTDTSDNITSVQTSLTIDGLGAEAGATVYLNSSITGALGAVYTPAPGPWTLDVELTAVGAHLVSAWVTDVAGNASVAGTMMIEIDLTPP